MRPCEHRSDGLCGECLAVLNKYILEDEALTDRRITSLESANSKLAAEIAELKENLKFVMRERDEAYDRGRSHELTEGNWLEVEKQRDTALAAKDAAEKALVRIASMEPHQHSSTCMLMHRIANDAVRALTPAPTQEPPAGGVTISTEKKGGDVECAPQAETQTAKLIRGSETSPTDSLRAEDQKHSETTASASNSPADVPSEGRGELLPFNLSDALAGKPVVTRDGRKVEKLRTAGSSLFLYPICGRANGEVWTWTKEGKETIGEDSPLDLFMLPTEGSGA